MCERTPVRWNTQKKTEGRERGGKRKKEADGRNKRVRTIDRAATEFVP